MLIVSIFVISSFEGGLCDSVFVTGVELLVFVCLVCLLVCLVAIYLDFVGVYLVLLT